MRHNHMAHLMLAGTLALSGCGTSAAPAPGANGLVTTPGAQLEQPAAKPQPQVKPGSQTPLAQPAQAPAAKPAPAAPATSTASGGGGGGGSKPASTASTGGTGASGGASTPAGGTAPVPVPPVVPPVGGMGYVANDFIVFASCRFPNEGNNDIYVFDPVLDTVLAVVGVNTYDNETNPRISDNGKWLVFQRSVGSYDCGCFHGNNDILMYSMGMKLVNTMPMLNTEEFDEYMPDVTDDGSKIVYVTEAGGFPEVRLFDVRTGDNWAVPGVNRNFADVTWPTISANGTKIAYGASILYGGGVAHDGTGTPTGGGAVTGNPLNFGESNIYVYDLVTGTQLTPPFVNTAYDEYNPDLCDDGSRMLFVSNRMGSEDVFEVSLDSGMTDNLSFLNTGELDEQHPRYLGYGVDRIVFQIKPVYGPGPIALRAYNRASATLDTLPVANHLFADSALRAPQSETLP